MTLEQQHEIEWHINRDLTQEEILAFELVEEILKSLDSKKWPFS